MGKTTTKKLISRQEITNVLMALDVGDIDAKAAAAKMQCSLSTVYNRLRSFQACGKVLLKHGNTGRAPVNKMPAQQRHELKTLLSGKYVGFNAQQVLRYLRQDEGIVVSRETVRRIIRENEDLAKRGTRNEVAVHQPRRRRSRFGELIQIDGSPHNWLMQDGPEPDLFCLSIFVDDATSMITAARFSPTENTSTYLALVEEHVNKYGIPEAFYSDRHSIFLPVASPSKNMAAKQEAALTQYQRVCDQLGIERIYALSPAAKGRVERAFQTLQGRWPQELRLKGAQSIDEANELLPELVKAYNEEFAVEAYIPEDAHVPFGSDRENLHRLCAHWVKRKLSKRLTCRYQSWILRVIGVAENWLLIGSEVYVVDYGQDKYELLLRDPTDNKLKSLAFERLKKKQTEPVEKFVTTKQIDEAWKRAIRQKERNRRSGWLAKREQKAEEALRRREEEVKQKEVALKERQTKKARSKD